MYLYLQVHYIYIHWGAVTQPNDDTVYWRIHASPGGEPTKTVTNLITFEM